MKKPKGRNRKSRTARRAVAGALAVAALVTWWSAALAQQAETWTPAALPLVTKTGPLAAPADASSAVDAKFSAGVTSDYNYRGYTLSDHLPSVSANGEVDYNIFFASVNVASVQMPDLSHFQMTDTLGLRWTFGALTTEGGVGIYNYPGLANDPSYAEAYVAPSYAVTKQLTVGLNVYYAPDYYRTGAWENYNSLTAKYEIGWGLTFSAELGRQYFGTTRATATSPSIALPDYTYGNAGFAYTYKAFTFDVHYHATTLTKQSCFLITGTGSATGGSNGCDQAVIATLTWNAGLADVKAALAGTK
jgi:uncharacterized protein (TIGR02001 family)